MSDPLDRLRNTLADRYTIPRELGRGGMATVYLAHEMKHDREVAIKVLRPELAATLGADRFLREIKIAAKLTHPHILALHDSGEAGGFLYYVMPYVEGESLRDRLNRERQLPLEDAVRIAREVASALSHAHSQGVIHRDIKPENILLSAGEAVVADFGIARAVSAAGGEQLTETGMAVGTPAYMSPEQATADKVDGRSDIYSLACVLYEMVGGDPPFLGSTPQSILARKLSEAVPSLQVVRTTVPDSLEHAVMKALAQVPADRFMTAEAFSEALTGSDEPATDKARVVEGRRITLKRVLYAGGLLVILVALWWGGSVVRGAFSNVSSTAEGVAFGLERLVVLPFQNLTGDTTQEYLIDGLMEELTSELAKAGALEVRSRTSAIRYKGTELSAPEIGRELSVDGLVEGSVMGWGDTVRVVVQLVDAARDAHRWSREYTEPYERLPMVSGQMARDLLAVLLPDEPRTEAGRELNPPTENIVAYELYQQGVRELYRLDLRAIDLFNAAILEDSTFALAYAGLADMYTVLPGLVSTGDHTRPREYVDLARDAVVTALRLDPNLSEARATRGVLLT